MSAKQLLAIGGAISLLGGVAASQQVQRLTPSEAREHVGEVATVCGTVIAARCDPSKTALLDLRTLTGSGTVSVAIGQADRAAFGDRLESRHDQRDVCATGRIERAGLDHHVMVTSPERLRIEGEPAGRAAVMDEAFSSCDPGVSLPKVLRDVKPSYVQDAMRDRIQGTVMMRGIVDATGKVQNVQVVTSLDPRLDERAVDAFSQWRFTPGTRNNQPVPVSIVVEMTFMLK